MQELDGASPANVTANLLTGLNIDEYFARADSNGAMNFLTDAMGSTLALADSSGAINTSYTYEPFGNTSVGGSNANPYQFTGRENDGTGLYFYRARYYSPTFQRFISQDPLGLASRALNLYVYASNNPVLLADPLGLTDTCVGIWIVIDSKSIALFVGDPRTGGSTGFCTCRWGCLACDGSLDLYANDLRPWTSGNEIETQRGKRCLAKPPAPQTGCPNKSR